MSRWEPIETAPSGRSILGWAPGWSDPEIIYRAAPDAIWQEGDEYGDFIDLGDEPTHWLDWRPLP